MHMSCSNRIERRLQNSKCCVLLQPSQSGTTAVSSARGYQCTTCLRTLSCSSALYRHIRNAHLGVFTHRCPICGQGFSNQPGLQGHLVQTHGHTQLKRACKVCGKEYAREDTLQRHMKYSHGGGDGSGSGEIVARHSNPVSTQQEQQQSGSEIPSTTAEMS